MEFRNDIQGLRAIAVLLVFIFHLSPEILPGGFIGVDIFFVISGYLISSIILFKIDGNKFSLLDFYYSRIKRIVPAYLFLLIVVAITAAFIFVPSDIANLRMGLFWSTLFNSNNYFATLDNYFGASSIENPILHTWTLAVEMQFYLFLPIILLFIKNKKFLILALIIASLLFLGYGTFEVLAKNKNVMYFSLLARTPEFFIGVLATLLPLRTSTFVKSNSLSLISLGILIIIASSFFINESSYFPGYLAVVPCLGTVLVLISSNNRISSALTNKSLVFLGEISYSIYLWHWPIMAFIRYHYDINGFNFFQISLVISLTILFSLFSYFFIEKAFRNYKGAKFYIPFAIISFTIVALINYIPRMNEKLIRIPIEYIAPTFGMNSHGKSFKAIETFGDTTYTGKKILLIGDSHALTMKNYLDILGKKNSFSFKTVTNDTYPTIPGLTPEIIKESRYYVQYKRLMDEVNKVISSTDIIILQFAGEGELWVIPIKAFVNSLKPNQSLIILSDYPSINKNPVRKNRGIVKNPKRDQQYDISFKPTSPKILEIINSNSNCYYINLVKSRVFENAPFYRDTLMYYDQAHLNVYGSKVYAENTEEKFMKRLNALINKN
jgi:peptidoglycan/LPS O-acetylase OafA/YrhL